MTGGWASSFKVGGGGGVGNKKLMGQNCRKGSGKQIISFGWEGKSSSCTRGPKGKLPVTDKKKKKNKNEVFVRNGSNQEHRNKTRTCHKKGKKGEKRLKITQIKLGELSDRFKKSIG